MWTSVFPDLSEISFAKLRSLVRLAGSILVVYACLGMSLTSAVRNLEQDAIGPAVKFEVSISTNVQHDPKPATRGSVTGGRDDQAKFFGKRLAKVASRSTEESARGAGLTVAFSVEPKSYVLVA